MCSAPCRAEKASRHARSSARMLATHRVCCASLSPSHLTGSCAGPAFLAPSIALASMIQVTTAKMVCASFTCTPDAFITDTFWKSEIIWTADLMQQGNFINVFLARHVSGTYAHHQEHYMLSCSIRFSAPSFWMDGGLESRCLGRVCGADVAVRRARRTA